jgi:hypothetical protein
MNARLVAIGGLLVVFLGVLGSALWWSDRTSSAVPSSREGTVADGHEIAEPIAQSGLRRPASEAAAPQAEAAPVVTPGEAPAPEPIADRDPEAVWEEKYQDADSRALEAARDEIRQAIHEGSFEELKRRLDSGLGEYIGQSHEVSPDPIDHEKITAVLQKTDGAQYRVVLPEWEFPELYLLKKESLWLQERWREVKVQELAKRGQ